jgi:predicted nucleotidyltransferase
VINIKICGIICEYNPLHKGHIYQLNKAREITGADFIVCIMSGNFVQRGENAVFDKFSRAKAVIEAGADAVIELPSIYTLQSAEYFAYGGVQIADNIGCTDLCFGSECGDISILKSTIADESFKSNMKNGVSYGKALSVFDGEPNNLLGKEYLKALELLDSPIIPSTVKRSVNYFSASKIRNDLKEGLKNGEMESFSTSPLFFDRFFEIIKSKIIMMSSDHIAKICGVNEGLEHKIKNEVLISNSLDELILNIKSKRYTYSRISRILCCILLDITKSKLRLLINDPPKAKLLGIKKEKALILSLLNNYYISPLDAEKSTESTRISSETNVLSTQIYSIFSDFIGDEDYTLGLMKF